MASDKKMYGLGRRKTAVAQVKLSNTPNARTVNGQTLDVYFSTVGMQAAVLAPLRVTSLDDTHGFAMKVHGGGKHSQAEAGKLAIARALLTIDEGYRKQLRASGFLTRDPRAKERKKPGLKRARRAPQFSKR